MTTTVILTFLLISSLLAAAATAPPPSLGRPGCAEDLVFLSPCLPYVSASPNNLTETVTHQCCEAFSSVFESGWGNCLSYLLRQPMILGFPLNATRVLWLSSVCTEGNGSLASGADGSLEYLCSSELPKLPPLQSTTGSEISNPSDSGPEGSATSSVSLPPESDRKSPFPFSLPPISAVRSPPQPSSSVQAARGSSATEKICNSNCWFLLGMLICLVSIRI